MTGPMPTKAEPIEAAEVSKQYTLADVDPIGRTEVLLYGDPGTGKTVAAATFPPPFRWLDADGGLKSIRWAFKHGITSLTRLEDLVAYRPTELLDGQYIARDKRPIAFDKSCDMIAYWFSPGQVDNWQTLVLDSGTELQAWAMLKALELNGRLKIGKEIISRSHATNLEAGAMIARVQQDYKSEQGLFEGFLQEVRVDCVNHSKNLVLICHKFTETDDDGNVLKYMPLLTGQLRERIVKSFDDVWFLEMIGGKVGVQTHGSGRVLAKTRWGQVFGAAEEPDYRKMLAKVRTFHGL